MAEETIGGLIRKEVNKQGRNITEFADAIGVCRQDAYSIFKRHNIDILLLKRISVALQHDFFEDLYKNPGLTDLNDPAIEKEVNNNKAMMQFMDVVPKIMKRWNKEANIVRTLIDVDGGTHIPDMGLQIMGCPDILITLTIGEWLIERYEGDPGSLLKASSIYSDDNPEVRVDIWENIYHGNNMIEVKLDYKTEKEWEATLKFAIEQFYKHSKQFKYYGLR